MTESIGIQQQPVSEKSRGTEFPQDNCAQPPFMQNLLERGDIEMHQGRPIMTPRLFHDICEIFAGRYIEPKVKEEINEP